MGLRVAIVIVVMLIAAGCGNAAKSTPSTNSASPSSSPVEGQGGTAPRCATPQLQIAQADHEGAAGNGRSVFRIVSRASQACYLQGYPGAELVDGSGHHLADASRSLTSFFGTYPAPRRVTITPGGFATFDLTWVEKRSVRGRHTRVEASLLQDHATGRL
jgi:hypothetical protein